MSTKNSGMAVAAMVLGIVSIVFNFIPFVSWIGLICAVVAIILGAIARGAIKSSNGQLGGAGMATAGIVMGVITIVLAIIGMIACASILGSFISS